MLTHFHRKGKLMRHILALLLFTLVSLTQAYARPTTPKAGVWRFELRYPHVAVPFLMELEPGRRGWTGTLVNGRERIPLNEIRVAKGRWIIPLQTYQNHLELEIRSKERIAGFFVKNGVSPAERIPLEGRHGVIRRFEREKADPTQDLSGKWSMEITGPDGKKTQAVALFDQQGSTLYASIMLPTGDLRYIDGHVAGDTFTTAAFDGVFNFVFRGKLEGKTLKGEIAGKIVETFTARRDAKASLPDPLKVASAETLSFSFPDTEGKTVSLDDPRFKGKPVIVQIFGSWCPNCIDELQFLAPWYRENAKRGIEVVAVSFERAPSPEEARRHLNMVAKKRQIPYPVLLAGTSRDDKPEAKLPGLKGFASFPTTIFLDRGHKVVKVHSGFNGPGTGLYYEEFKKLFHETVEKLLR